ncbi:MAG: hypothetical protein A7316_01400 [Candidatus Altiarchaeales archaeon WOR_SM1_86-2]|nr:MAG: hypothetical protein A7315_14305 [Candidatus Altiarchaeales archaeon WOR_SM1_79]ODS37973.1 MAG: hypothetical protein A7316_01400 [Candidatus Altiarchaeales archaeon WOR_SM1_86-2]
MLAKFIVSGATIQGVQFRETLSKIAKNLELKGQVKNLHKGDVEVIFLYNDNEGIIRKCFEKTIGTLKEKELIDEWDAGDIKIDGNSLNEFEVYKLDDPKTERKIKDFRIIREHELKEMTWALQGAGRVFLSASKKIEGVLKRKKEEVIGRLNSVNQELLYAQTNLKNVDDLVCIKHFIADPLIFVSVGEQDEEDLIKMLIEFYYEFLRYKKLKEHITDKDEEDIVERIDALRERICKEIQKQIDKS